MHPINRSSQVTVMHVVGTLCAVCRHLSNNLMTVQGREAHHQYEYR